MMAKAFVTSASAAVGLPGLPFGPAAKLPSAASDTLRDYDKIADIGSWFNYVTPNYPHNKAILDTDKKFQTLFFDIGKIAGFEGTAFGDGIYGPYSDEMEDISPYKFDLYNHPPLGSINERVDLCTSLEMHRFYLRYLEKAENYVAQNPDILNAVPDYAQQIEAIRNNIETLRKANEDYRRELKGNAPACGLLA